MSSSSVVILLILAVVQTHALPSPKYHEQPCKPGKQSWGYAEVRPGANMFYWLFCANSTKTQPLLIWLQGGPGASSTGMGNFMEIGPLDVNQKNRTDTWVNDVNVLFVDNPVGTGYSYVNDSSLLPKNNTQVAQDLVTLLKKFFSKVELFNNVPIYILGESYGGKMAAGFSVALLKEIQKKKIKCSLAGLILADSWISPVDAVMSWGPYLYTLSMVDTAALHRINALAKETKTAIDKHAMKNATELFFKVENLIMNETNNVNFYNVLKEREDDDLSRIQNMISSSEEKSKSSIDNLYFRHVVKLQSSKLSALMNGPIKTQLGIPDNVTWGGQSKLVFEALSDDFMSPAVKDVETILNNTKIPVIVYNGQLDLICSTPSTERWASDMKWAGTGAWRNAKRLPEQINNSTIWFEKSYKNFHFFWILRAGHMVPIDQLHVSRRLIQKIIGVKH